jgi:hypothetical protein
MAVNSSAAVFRFYFNGIINSKDCLPNTDHAVLAVGYGTDN